MPPFSMRFTIIVLALSFTTVAHAQVDDWFVSGSIIYNNDDPYRAIDDSVSGVQVSAGRNMTEHLSLEGMLGYSGISAEPCAPLDCFPDQNHLNVSANLLVGHRPKLHKLKRIPVQAGSQLFEKYRAA